MEGKPLKASAKSSSHHGSGRSSLQDIRNMWTTATLSQPKLNVQLPTVREDSELEDVSVSGKTLWSYDQKAGHDAEGGWEASDGGEDKDSFKPEEPEELELGGDSSQGSRLEEDDSKTDNEKPSSVSSLNISRHTPHRAYWVEQQSRLPLPLTELMENEALEILTKPSGVSLPPLLLHATPTLAPNFHKRPWGFCRPWSYRVGFQDVFALSDSLTTHKYSRSFRKSKS
uniref:Uncharacterized protein n=1 Tax=Bos mutus grunniens TaxID=30521 RepID=A0A8B9Z5Q5_BOSMU